MTRFLLAAAVAATPLLTATGAAQAQIRPAILYIPQVSSYQRTVALELGDFKQAGFAAGYQRVIADKRGALVPGSAGFFKVRLERGVLYRLGARCDDDCNDVDLVLRDASGRELIADRDPDDTPGFTFRPNWTGEYTVVIELPASGCNAGRCQVGATVLARQVGATFSAL
jgi:hypothetical protein